MVKLSPYFYVRIFKNGKVDILKRMTMACWLSSEFTLQCFSEQVL